MNEEIQYKMTDEIAFQLGKFDFSAFYSYARWQINKESFPLLHFFEWSMDWGTPCIKVGDKYETDWEGFSLLGKLKTDKISDISHKLNYIRGRLKSYSVTIEPNKIGIYYANSYDFRDFIAKCFQDVIMDEFVLDKPSDETLSLRKFKKNFPKYHISKSEMLGTIPGTPNVVLEADEEVIKYIIGK